jgi:hypothetical protein
VHQDETIVIFLDRALPDELDAANIRIESSDLGSADLEKTLSEDRRRLIVKIRTGRPDFRFAGVHGEDKNASGLSIDLGDGVRQSIDLQIRQRAPNLVGATWIDSSPDGSPGGGNGVVNRGDRLRLRFDDRVTLAAGANASPVEVPGQMLLSREGVDRLDDGTEVSTWSTTTTGRDDEVEIVLGSHPVLRVEGEYKTSLAGIDRDRPDMPSGLTVNGTDMRPMTAVIGAAGHRGVASTGEVDVAIPRQLEQRLASFSAKRKRLLPELGSRSLHSVTPFLGKYAIVAGGLDPDSDQRRVLRDVLLLSTRADGDGAIDIGSLESLPDLPSPAFEHSATLLPGPDRELGTRDDMVLIAGGIDDLGRTLGDLSVVYLSATGRGVSLLKLPSKLRTPRAEHATIAVRHDRVLIDGGRSSGRRSRESGLVPTAELLTIRREGDRIFVDEHLTFASLARKRHTLTLLEGPREDDPWVLAYGGFGRNLSREPSRNAKTRRTTLRFGQSVDVNAAVDLFPESDATVLYCPTLIRLAQPTDSIEKLEHELDPTFLRHGHRAQGLAAEPTKRLARAREVLVHGGTLAHPTRGTEGPYFDLWEISVTQYLQDLDHQRPTEDAALDGVRFLFNRENPGASRLEIVPHPTLRPELLVPKEGFSMTEVPGLGIVFAGGEAASRRSENAPPELLSTVEIYFTTGDLAGELRELAWSLQTPRSRHDAYLVMREGRRFLLLVGGHTTIVGDPGTDVEVFPLP